MTAFRFAKKTFTGWFEILLTILALILVLARLNPVYVILGAMPLGVIYAYWQKTHAKITTTEEFPK